MPDKARPKDGKSSESPLAPEVAPSTPDQMIQEALAALSQLGFESSEPKHSSGTLTALVQVRDSLNHAQLNLRNAIETNRELLSSAEETHTSALKSLEPLYRRRALVEE